MFVALFLAVLAVELIAYAVVRSYLAAGQRIDAERVAAVTARARDGGRFIGRADRLGE